MDRFLQKGKEVGIDGAEILSKVMCNDASLKQKGKRTGNNKVKHQKPMACLIVKSVMHPSSDPGERRRESSNWQSGE
jgi:hypothetical protein